MVNKYYLIGFFLFFVLVTFHTNAQKKLERQVKRLEVEADQLYQSRLWKEALELYLVLDSVSPGNPEYQFRTGVIYYHSVDKARSLDYFLKAIENGKRDPKLNFYLGRAYHFNLCFDSAVTYYRKALMAPDSIGGLDKKERFEIEKHIQDCQLAAKYTEDPLITPITNIKEPVNSSFPEYVPLVSADESKLIFTSRRPNTTGNGVDAQGIFMEDIYISYKNENGRWSEPDNDLNFNTTEHDACVGLSPDGNTLILYRSDNGGDLYLSRFDGENWLEPEPLNEINTSHWESSACFSSDGQYIYFTSDKPGGYGGSDIYKAKLLADNKYGEIENLGTGINTRYDEDAPQIHSDGKTLFFSSKGHQGLGGYDIYSSVLNEKNGKWSEPRNIGYPINTPDDDIYFTLLSSGTKGYFSSYRSDSYGEKDIYMISRPQSVPTKFLMKFALFDPYQNKPIHARISITNENSDQTIELNSTDTIKGKYAVPLDFDTNYTLGIEAEGYQFKEKKIQMGYRADIFEYVMNIVPKKEEVIVLMDSIEYMNVLNSDTSMLSGRPTKQLSGSNDLLVYNDLDETNSEKNKQKKPGQDLSEIQGEPGNVNRAEKPRRASEGTLNYNENQSEVIKVSTSSNAFDTEKIVTKEVNGTKNELVASLNILSDDENIKLIMHQKSEVILLTRRNPTDKLVLPMINFPYNSYTLNSEQKKEIADLAGFLKRNKQIELILLGHTDSKGRATYNKWLSDQRANSVRKEIMISGVDVSRIHVLGLGEDYPLMSNDSDLGRTINRRTNFIFIDTYDRRYLETPYDSLISRFNIKVRQNPSKGSNMLIWEKLPVSVHFPENSAETITEYSNEKLKFLVSYIKHLPVKLVFCGFEDPESENSGLRLAQKRASLVKTQLIRLGIPEERLIMIDKKDIQNIFDINYYPKGVQRQRVQFFTVGN